MSNPWWSLREPSNSQAPRAPEPSRGARRDSQAVSRTWFETIEEMLGALDT